MRANVNETWDVIPFLLIQILKFHVESVMSRFTRFSSGKFLYFGKCAGVKHLTNIMSGSHSPIGQGQVYIELPGQLKTG